MNRCKQALENHRRRKANEVIKHERKQIAEVKNRIARDREREKQARTNIGNITKRIDSLTQFDIGTRNRSSFYRQGFLSDIALLGMINLAVKEVLVNDDPLLTDGNVIEHDTNEFKEN